MTPHQLPWKHHSVKHRLTERSRLIHTGQVLILQVDLQVLILQVLILQVLILQVDSTGSDSTGSDSTGSAITNTERQLKPVMGES